MKKLLQTLAAVVVAAVIAVTASLLLYSPKGPFEIPEGTKFIAHRGLSSQYFENSEAAFLGAAQSDFFFAIETDIWLSAEGVWLCAHDNNPFQNGQKLISEITAAEAAALPLDTSISQYERSKDNVYICTLERYLEICKEYDKMPVIELKYVAEDWQIADLADIISAIIPIERVMFISFHAKNISNLNKISGARTMLLTGNALVAASIAASGASLGINKKILTKKLVQLTKEKGAEINVYTVNNRTTAERFIEMGVDYITTDYIF